MVLGYFEALLSNTEHAPGSCRKNAIIDNGTVYVIIQIREDVLVCCAGGGKGACCCGEEEHAVTSQYHPVLAAHAQRLQNQLLPCDCFPELCVHSGAEGNRRSMNLCVDEGPNQVGGSME